MAANKIENDIPKGITTREQVLLKEIKRNESYIKVQPKNALFHSANANHYFDLGNLLKRFDVSQAQTYFQSALTTIDIAIENDALCARYLLRRCEINLHLNDVSRAKQDLKQVKLLRKNKDYKFTEECEDTVTQGVITREIEKLSIEVKKLQPEQELDEIEVRGLAL